jgi:hypothetical protein
VFGRKYILDFGEPYQPEVPKNPNLFYQDAQNIAAGSRVTRALDAFSKRIEGEVAEAIYERDEGRRITNLNIAFEVEKTAELTSSKCEITIYNLSDASVAILDMNKGLKTFIRLRAGYDYSAGPQDIDQKILLNAASDLNGRRDASVPQGVLQIFKGVVDSHRTYMEGPDRVTVLTCSDAADLAWAVSSHEFPKGTSYRDIVRILLRDINLPTDIVEEIPEVFVTNRPVYLYGKTSDLLLELGSQWGLSFSISDMAMSITQRKSEDAGKTRGFAPYIGANSGLIGRVEPADDTTSSSSMNDVASGKSIKFTCLMRGDILPQQPIFLDTNSKIGSTPIKGFYKVSKVTHKGEYEGSDWYTEVEAEEASEAYSLIDLQRNVPLSGNRGAPLGTA